MNIEVGKEGVNEKNSERFLTKGLFAVTVAQFLSALADNALLFAVLSLAKSLNYESWIEPVFQLLFVSVYVITAPFVGSFADNYDKGRVMLISNGLKFIGALYILVIGNAFIGYLLVGLGAAIYSPAKYGILSQLVKSEHLVKANGLIEASTLFAIISGAIIGGVVADNNVTYCFILCVSIYGLACIANLFIPSLPILVERIKLSPKVQTLRFINDLIVLFSDKVSRVTLIGSGLFWGAGITLRFLMLAWVPYVLGLTDKTTPSLLNAAVAIGIIFGSIIASKYITLGKIKWALTSGVAMGLLVVIMMLIDMSYLMTNHIPTQEEWMNIHSGLWSIYLILTVIGVLGGIFIVPINALFQYQGKKLVGVGKAIAVQNFTENLSMLVMLAIFTIFSSFEITPIIMGVGFGALLSLCMLVVLKIKAKPITMDKPL
ncbi:lysophospholipid transporter LplT [Thorsellia kenyensis]|uniref:Lysophospholipid transporter LplT n=1 Tax=Thorsellia kenyensis TaxID=1549888 RepID=A0ABV6CCD2_9GAMM